MRRAAALLVSALVLSGCGGDTESRPAAGKSKTAGKPKASATPDACPKAERKIKALKPPKDSDEMIDYADAAAQALPSSRPAVAALYDIQLPAADVDVKRLQEKLAALEQAVTDDCGEREAFEKLAALGYDFGLTDAIKHDNRIGKKRPAAGDLEAGFAFDARRMRDMAGALEALTVPSGIERQHERFLRSVKRFGARSTKASRTPSAAHFPALEKLGAQRDRALRSLDRALAGMLRG